MKGFAGYAHTMTAVEQRLGHKVKSLEQELSGAKDAVLRPMGVTVPQYTALLVINDEPGISGAELARNGFQKADISGVRPWRSPGLFVAAPRAYA